MKDAKKHPRFADVPKQGRSKLEQRLTTLEKYSAAADDRVRGLTHDAFNFAMEEVGAVAKESNEVLKTTNEILKSFKKLG